MAFLGQLTANVQAQLNSVKPQLNSVLESATRARDNLTPILNKATAQLDSLGRMLQVKADRKQSPIDIVASVTSFDALLEETVFTVKYPANGQLKLINAGHSLQLVPIDVKAEFEMSANGARYVLDSMSLHWGTEPMNGSEHTVGGVGYAGELHLLHTNMQCPSVEQALKEHRGVIGLAVLLNESHDDNPALAPIIDGIAQIVYKGSECAVHRVNMRQLLPPAEKMREFWMYDGSETIAPYREDVSWLVYRATVPISSHQLDQLRTLHQEGYESEEEHGMEPLRAVQPLNNRVVRASFRSAAQAQPI